LWNLVWSGLVTNDTFHALRAFTRARPSRTRHGHAPASSFRSRRLVPRSAEGRWTLVARDGAGESAAAPTRATAWITAEAQQLLARHGVVTRESLAFENIPGGFSTVYPVLKLMEESGRLRRGYFVTGLGATQFALPGAVDRLRSLRDAPEVAEVAVLAATDPANPYGATLPWSRPQSASTSISPRKSRRHATSSAASVSSLDKAPASGQRAREGEETGSASPGAGVTAGAGRGPTRTVGATVILVNGALTAYLARGDRQLLTFLPEAEPERSNAARAVAGALNERARSAGSDGPRGMLIEEINGGMPAVDPLAPYLVEAGFVAGALGFQPNFRL
jgi:ATP-dependent Lhr-like helicase